MWRPDLNNTDHMIGGTDFSFKVLNDQEEYEFRHHAVNNDPPDGIPWSILHPVCREEWVKRGLVEDK